MNSTIVAAVVRHLLTALGGGLLASKGLDAAGVEAVVGAVATLAGVAWSVHEKKQRPG